MRIVGVGLQRGVLILIGVVALCAPVQTMGRNCVESTAEWLAMESREITLVHETGSTVRFGAKVADDGPERAAGFQHICPQVIDQTPILFVFGGPSRPAFHMRNVHAPLDIAFIDRNGRIDEIRQMNPYILGARNKPVYHPRVPVSAAIEAYAGFFDQQGVDARSWSLVLSD